MKESQVSRKTELIQTKYGALKPNQGSFDVRKKYREAVTYYEDGTVASVYLDELTPIDSPIGRIKAELLTFYPNGNIKRLFPLYGQISGYWTEDDEYGLAEQVKITALGKDFYTKPLCIAFYPSGALKSLTVWRQETIQVPTKYGEVSSNFGFELTEDGRLKSVEPVFGTRVTSEYGTLYPYDCENYRLHAENNSLVFDKGERLLSMKTIRNKVLLNEKGRRRTIESRVVEDRLFGVSMLMPLKLTFEKTGLVVEDMGGLEETSEYENIEIVA